MRIIPTKYNGIRYRSRTEARWAVVFDQLGWKHYYEFEGFDLNGDLYLPDFYLPDSRTFFEVKGRQPDKRARDLATRLCEQTVCQVIISTGPPNPNREPWDMDLVTFVPEMIYDKVLCFEYKGGFVDRRWPHHPACAIDLGNLGHIGSHNEISWRNAFIAAADNRFSVFD